MPSNAAPQWFIRETPVPTPSGPPNPKLLDRVRHAIRIRHYSRRTEEAYVGWIRRFIRFHHTRHPSEMGEREVTTFLTSLAIARRVSASTQNQALSAILFLYEHVLNRELDWLQDVVRARTQRRIPVVLTRDEVRAVLGRLDGIPKLVASLLYGAGLRLFEGLRLRIKDLDFERREIVVRDGKGGRDRRTMLPARLHDAIVAHVAPPRAGTTATSPAAPAGSSFLTRSAASIQAPGARGPGSGSFQRRDSTLTAQRSSAAGITCTRQLSSGR